jgi:hypothetical protein
LSVDGLGGLLGQANPSNLRVRVGLGAGLTGLGLSCVAKGAAFLPLSRGFQRAIYNFGAFQRS